MSRITRERFPLFDYIILSSFYASLIQFDLEKIANLLEATNCRMSNDVVLRGKEPCFNQKHSMNEFMKQYQIFGIWAEREENRLSKTIGNPQNLTERICKLNDP